MRLLKGFVLFIAAVCLFSACDGLTGKLKLIEGNFFFSRGKFNEAIGVYLEAREDQRLAPYADFALGTTYLVLEQDDTALERFSTAEQNLPSNGENRNLLYRIRYNRGVVKFQQGDFEGAADDFRGALETDSSARDAKQNLELSLVSLYMKNQASGIQEIRTSTIAEEQDKKRSEIIFDFVRQKEVDKWKSWEWTGGDEDDGPDY
ncbi:MAG: tetratricopeptide repeat protein [Spirochaetaceae bacterium]|jgi:Ca-activated chloride channel family protein|nr:tetratricopeptide repeat protein [Spirochaetaceae bacterium]